MTKAKARVSSLRSDGKGKSSAKGDKGKGKCKQPRNDGKGKSAPKVTKAKGKARLTSATFNATIACVTVTMPMSVGSPRAALR